MHDTSVIYSQRLDAIVEYAHDGILTVDKDSRITFINAAARKMFGYEQDQTSELSLEQLIPAKFRPNHDNYVKNFRRSQERARTMRTRTSVMGLHRDGTEFPLDISLSKIIVGGDIEMVAVMRDTSENTRIMEELREAATLDHLTGLANKRLFNEEMLHQFAVSKRYKRSLSLIMVDLDHFKQVNDRFGHTCGDAVLINTAALIKNKVRESDIVSRWGGEEFALLLPETDLEGAVKLAEVIRNELASSQHILQEQEVIVTASFGVVEMDVSNSSIEEEFVRADTLLYAAKRAGRNCVSF